MVIALKNVHRHVQERDADEQRANAWNVLFTCPVHTVIALDIA